uniref:Enthoprotin-like polypeptide n=1 Tax=Mesocricetus auratus TaxID=10036 RepID=Q6Q2U1_MESAU|nr:enthoprotin-like polypeptide [Mesocricetus auratus]
MKVKCSNLKLNIKVRTQQCSRLDFILYLFCLGFECL